MTKKGGKMRKSIVGLLVGVLFCSMSFGVMVYADSDAESEKWISKPINVVTRIELDSLPIKYPCEGVQGYIEVKTLGKFDDACIQGENGQLKIARFIHAGIYKYGVQFPSESNFYELRGACTLPRCVYSASSDMLIDHMLVPSWRYTALVYKSFSKSLVKRTDAVSLQTYFQFQPATPPFYTAKIGEYMPSVEATTISSNGKWALLELKSYGIVRINLETGEARRIVAPGAEYGLGRDPTFELAISNDGKNIAVMGVGGGLAVVEVNEHCGDGLVPGMESAFSRSVIPCKSADINTGVMFPNLSYADTPRFDPDAKQLSFIACYKDGRIEQVVLSPFNLPAQQVISYLALGDSFTSGEGESSDAYYQTGTNEPNAKCHLSIRSYPYLLGEGWKKLTKSVACSGAKTDDILGRSDYAGQAMRLLSLPNDEVVSNKEKALITIQPGIVPQSTFATRYLPEFISVGIGGNDAGLVAKLTGCLSVGICEWASDPVKRYATSEEISAIYPKIREVLKSLRAASPIAQIVMVGYPQIINPVPSALCDQLTGLLLDAPERTFIYETVHYLNEVVRAAAFAEGVAFIDIEDSLKGHELCGEQDSSAMNAVRIGDDIAPIRTLPTFTLFGAESFHPTYKGHALIAQAILKKYPSTNLISSCGCGNNTSLPQPSAYWTLDEESKKQERKQIEDESISAPLIIMAKKFTVTSPALFFLPGSTVALELHSTPITLGEVKTKGDGSIEFTDMIPETLPAGYHVLHLLGTSPSGQPIDVYRSVFIRPKDNIIPSSLQIKPELGAPPVGTDLPMTTNNPANTGEVLGTSMHYTSHSFLTPLKPTVSKKSTIHGIFVWIWGLGGVLFIAIVALWLWFSSRDSKR